MKPKSELNGLNNTNRTKSNEVYHETEFGLLPYEWKLIRVGEFFKISGGGTPSTKKSEYWNGNIPWLTPTDVTSYLSSSPSLKIGRSVKYISELGLKKSSAKLMPSNSILMTSRATIGDVVINEIPMSTNQGFINIFPHEDVNNEFLAYWLMKNKNYIISLASGTTFKEISKGIFNTIDIPLPPLPEQEKIAAILSTALDSIEKTDAVIDAIKSLKKSLMKHLFTYGPVPVDEAEKVELKETEFGSVPKEWETVTLEEITDVSYGIQASVSQNTDPSIGLPILTNVNITFDGVLDISELKYYDLSQKKNGERYLLQKGDVLFNWRSGSKSHVGKTAYFDLDAEMLCSSFILRIRSLDKDNLDSKYIFYYLSFLRNIIHYFENITDYLINAKFNASHAKKVPIQVPSISVQKQIVNCITSIDMRLLAEENKRKALQELFNTLINELMAAKMRVGDLEV